jgi:hypothetical protein
LTEFLVKPETRKKDRQYIEMDSVIKHIKELNNFDIIGFTEKELGKSLLDRINNIAKIRYKLAENNMKQLIHIFGSLDTLSTPLYFVCGADIFDGLTWLRYSYNNGHTIYQQNEWIENLSFNRDDVYLRQTTFIRNFDYLQGLTLQMKRFLKSYNFGEFKPHAELLKKAWNSVDKRGGL